MCSWSPPSGSCQPANRRIGKRPCARDLRTQSRVRFSGQFSSRIQGYRPRHADSGAPAGVGFGPGWEHADLGAPVDNFPHREQCLTKSARRLGCAFTQTRVRFGRESRRVRCASTQTRVRSYADSGAHLIAKHLTINVFSASLIDILIGSYRLFPIDTYISDRGFLIF